MNKNTIKSSKLKSNIIDKNINSIDNVIEKIKKLDIMLNCYSIGDNLISIISKVNKLDKYEFTHQPIIKKVLGQIKEGIENGNISINFEKTCVGTTAEFINSNVDKSINISRSSSIIKSLIKNGEVDANFIKDCECMINEDYIILRHSGIEHFYKLEYNKKDINFEVEGSSLYGMSLFDVQKILPILWDVMNYKSNEFYLHSKEEYNFVTKGLGTYIDENIFIKLKGKKLFGAGNFNSTNGGGFNIYGDGFYLTDNIKDAVFYGKQFVSKYEVNGILFNGDAILPYYLVEEILWRAKYNKGIRMSFERLEKGINKVIELTRSGKYYNSKGELINILNFVGDQNFSNIVKDVLLHYGYDGIRFKNGNFDKNKGLNGYNYVLYNMS